MKKYVACLSLNKITDDGLMEKGILTDCDDAEKILKQEYGERCGASCFIYERLSDSESGNVISQAFRKEDGSLVVRKFWGYYSKKMLENHIDIDKVTQFYNDYKKSDCRTIRGDEVIESLYTSLKKYNNIYINGYTDEAYERLVLNRGTLRMNNTNKKIIAREVAPEQVDFRNYFDNDGFTDKSGENCACYIPSSRNCNGFNATEYDKVVNDADNILDELCNGASIKSACEYALSAEKFNTIKNNTKKLHALKEWAKTADTTKSEDIVVYLNITSTSKEWAMRSFKGYSQGDYCEVIYCKEHYSEDSITRIGNFWLGCGTEFEIDDCGGFYVLDDIRWQEGDTLRKYLAEEYGCEPEELEIYLYDGNHVVNDYRIMK